MKLLRITGLIVFLLSAAAFTTYNIYKINTVDTNEPAINCNSNTIAVSTKASEKELLKDVTAIDKEDGNITQNLFVEKISAFIGKNKRIITYAAYDSNCNVTEKERDLTYTDYIPPRFVLTKPLIFQVDDEVDIIKNMTVTDCLDGDLTNKIKYEMPDQFFDESEGSFIIKFNVINSAGDTATLPVTVDFHYPYSNPEKMPMINLNQYIVYLKTKTYFDAKAYLKDVKIGDKQYSFQDGMTDGKDNKYISKNSITIQSNVNMQLPGVYEVNYTMKTEDGFKGTTRLIVVVEE